MTQTIFKRKEVKYLLDSDEYHYLSKVVAQHMKPDKHHRSSISNLYFDTENNDLIIQSLEKPDYKYKVRARSYGEASSGLVFFEIKSKLDGIVYKRRAVLSTSAYEDYLSTGSYADSQVMRELDHLFMSKDLLPKMYIAYDRKSYAAKDDSGLRITFDSNLRSRTQDLSVELADDCEDHFADDTYILEIKTTGGLPEWLTSALSRRAIYPESFSKYGKIYQKHTARSVAHV